MGRMTGWLYEAHRRRQDITTFSIILTIYLLLGLRHSSRTYAGLKSISDKNDRGEELEEWEVDLSAEAYRMQIAWGDKFIPALIIISTVFWLPTKLYAMWRG